MKHISDLSKEELIELAIKLEIPIERELLFAFQKKELIQTISNKLVDIEIEKFLAKKPTQIIKKTKSKGDGMDGNPVTSAWLKKTMRPGDIIKDSKLLF